MKVISGIYENTAKNPKDDKKTGQALQDAIPNSV